MRTLNRPQNLKVFNSDGISPGSFGCRSANMTDLVNSSKGNQDSQLAADVKTPTINDDEQRKLSAEGQLDTPMPKKMNIHDEEGQEKEMITNLFHRNDPSSKQGTLLIKRSKKKIIEFPGFEYNKDLDQEEYAELNTPVKKSRSGSISSFSDPESDDSHCSLG